MTSMTSSSSNQHDGLLDGEERRYRVELRGSAEPGGPYPRGTFRQVVTAMATVVMAVAATYVVPSWHWARPWTPDSTYVPFWNLIGRELLGEGGKAGSMSNDFASGVERASTTSPLLRPKRSA